MENKGLHHNPVTSELKHTLKLRVIYSLVLLAIVFPCFILGGWFYFALVFAVIGCSTYEIAKAPSRKFSWFIWVITFVVMYSLVFWVVVKTNNGHWDLFDINTSFKGLTISPVAISVMIGLFFLIVVLKDDFGVTDACYLIAMTLLLSLGFQALLYLRYIPFTLFNGVDGVDISTSAFKYGQSAFLLLYLLIAICFNDIGAYLVGVFFGKHKINPRISPKKTWEGFIGGIVISAAFSLTFALVSAKCNFAVTPFFTIQKWYWVLLCSVVLPFLGNLGDFTFSSIKRHFGTKDYSHILGPHGGFLDRIDSVLFGGLGLAILLIFISNGWNFYK